jgi:AhpC/TSA family
LNPEPDSYDDEHKGSPEDLRKAARPYSAIVGLLFLVAVLIAGVNSLSNSGRAVRGLDDWTPLPRFAAPSATGNLDGDANVNRDDRSASGKRRTPACAVRGSRRDVIRICDFFQRPLVIVAWFTRGCGTCRRQLDTVESIRRRFPAVQFLGLDIADSLKNARKEVISHGWRFPMALDRDGAVSGLYGVGVGPTSFFAYPGGIAMETVFGELDRRQLELRLERLLRSSRRLGLLP